MQNILSKDFVKEKTIEIMKLKDQWKENKSVINVQNYIFGQCSVFLIEVNCISSTMVLSQNWPKQLFNSHQNPLIFAFRADIQTSGRGQKQNNWQSLEGNLYLTILLKLQFKYFPYLPLIAISNVFKTIKAYLEKQKSQSILKIKWINDILIDFEKVSGVLIRNQMIGQGLYTQIGIGVNLKQLPLQSQKMNTSATFLQKHINSHIQIKDFGLKLIETFQGSFYQQNFQKTILQSKLIYESNLAYLNKDVLIYDYKYQKILGSGLFRGINQYGHAIIEGNKNAFTQGRMKVHQSL